MHQTGKNYVYELDGLGLKMPVTFTALLVSGLSLTGIPLMGGFVSKWQLAEALLESAGTAGYIGVIVLMYSAIATGIYMLTIVVRAWFPGAGFKEELIKDYKDPSWHMKLPLIVFSIVTIVIGCYAQPLLDFAGNIAAGVL